jgi:hypothetical protein
MAYKISGTLNESSRIIIIDESTWEIEKNITTSVGSYEVPFLNPGKKLVIARNSSGESKSLGYITTTKYDGGIETYYGLNTSKASITVIDPDWDTIRMATIGAIGGSANYIDTSSTSDDIFINNSSEMYSIARIVFAFDLRSVPTIETGDTIELYIKSAKGPTTEDSYAVHISSQPILGTSVSMADYDDNGTFLAALHNTTNVPGWNTISSLESTSVKDIINGVSGDGYLRLMFSLANPVMAPSSSTSYTIYLPMGTGTEDEPYIKITRA